MRIPETQCQCKEFPDCPCLAQMTAEDLYCDICREGCSGIIIQSPKLGYDPDLWVYSRIPGVINPKEAGHHVIVKETNWNGSKVKTWNGTQVETWSVVT